MSKLTNFDELSLGLSKRSLLYSRQQKSKKITQNSSSPKPRITKSPTDPKYQTLKNFNKSQHLKSEETLTNLRIDNPELIKQIENLTLSLQECSKKLENMRMQNQELVNLVLKIIEGFVENSRLTSLFKNKIVLEIKTCLVQKLEEFSSQGFDYKNEIEQISLWRSRKEPIKYNENELHPLNPLGKVRGLNERLLAVYDFDGEMVNFI